MTSKLFLLNFDTKPLFFVFCIVGKWQHVFCAKIVPELNCQIHFIQNQNKDKKSATFSSNFVRKMVKIDWIWVKLVSIAAEVQEGNCNFLKRSRKVVKFHFNLLIELDGIARLLF